MIQFAAHIGKGRSRSGYGGNTPRLTFYITYRLLLFRWYICPMVTTQQISPEQFRARRILAGHKQESLACALGCTRVTINNFERGRTQRILVAKWDDVRRELRLDQAA